MDVSTVTIHKHQAWHTAERQSWDLDNINTDRGDATNKTKKPKDKAGKMRESKTH